MTLARTLTTHDLQDAQRALSAANGKLVRGRKIVVTYAQQAPLENAHTSMTGGKSRKVVSEAGRPTALSLLKTGEGAGGKSDGCARVLTFAYCLDLNHLPQHEEQDRTHGSQVETDGPSISQSQPRPPPAVTTAAFSSGTIPHPSHTPQAFGRVPAVQAIYLPPNAAERFEAQIVI